MNLRSIYVIKDRVSIEYYRNANQIIPSAILGIRSMRLMHPPQSVLGLPLSDHYKSLIKLTHLQVNV